LPVVLRDLRLLTPSSSQGTTPFPRLFRHLEMAPRTPQPSTAVRLYTGSRTPKPPTAVKPYTGPPYLTTRLSTEILLNIVGQLDWENASTPNASIPNAKQIHLARTCKRMAEVIRMISYAHISLKGPVMLSKILRLLRTLNETPHLGAMVRNIRLNSSECMGMFSAEDVQFTTQLSKRRIGIKRGELIRRGSAAYTWCDSSAHVMALLVSLAPNVSEVSMYCSMAGPTQFILARQQKSCIKPPVPRMTFSGPTSLKFGLTGEWGGNFYGVAEMVAAMPNLKHLELMGGKLLEFNTPTTFNTHAITSLRFTNCRLSRTTLGAITRNFTNLVEFFFEQDSQMKSTNSTRELLEGEWPSPKFVMEAAASSAATLERMTIICCSTLEQGPQDLIKTKDFDLIESVRGFPGLKELTINTECFTDLDINPQCISSGISVSALWGLARYSPSLMSLRIEGIHPFKEEELDYVANEIRERQIAMFKTLIFVKQRPRWEPAGYDLMEYKTTALRKVDDLREEEVLSYKFN